jgi:endonuclease/exonuclease/phosphatase (EEP) superfamily protein YafD
VDAIALTLIGIAFVGVTIRWTVKDGIPFAANLFYALPLIVVAGLLLASATIWMWNRRPAASVACAIAAVIAGGLWAHGAYFGNACNEATRGLRVLTWNTARGFGGWTRIAEHLATTDADLIGLVEGGGSTDEWKEFWNEQLPGYRSYLAGGGLVILTRGEIVETHVMRLPGWSSCADVRIELDGRRIRVLLVDAVVRPFSNRRDVIERSLELARAHPELPTIVMGDFNTPIDSVWFEEARRDFTHAFEEAGDGLFTTWPVPFPILAIDHIWLSRHFSVGCTRIGWSWVSDHRAIVTDVRLTDTLARGD